MTTNSEVTSNAQLPGRTDFDLISTMANVTSSLKKWWYIISPALYNRSTGFDFYIFGWFYTLFPYSKGWEDIAVLILIVHFCAWQCGICFIEYNKAKYFNTIYFTDTLYKLLVRQFHNRMKCKHLKTKHSNFFKKLTI